MPRPRNKQDLIKAGEEYYKKLLEMADAMTEKEMTTPFSVHISSVAFLLITIGQ